MPVLHVRTSITTYLSNDKLTITVEEQSTVVVLFFRSASRMLRTFFNNTVHVSDFCRVEKTKTTTTTTTKPR